MVALVAEDLVKQLLLSSTYITPSYWLEIGSSPRIGVLVMGGVRGRRGAVTEDTGESQTWCTLPSS